MTLIILMIALTASPLLQLPIHVPLHVANISFFLTVAIPELKYTVYGHILNTWFFLYFRSKGLLLKNFIIKIIRPPEKMIINIETVRI